jgi:hypothetical protein
MSDYILRSARHIAAQWLRGVVRPGDHAVDATMGNGYDTCLLAELAGESGHVTAFDVQEQALVNTRNRLTDAGLIERVTLCLSGHEHMAEYVRRPIRAVSFNLGWLPGSDKSVTTCWDTTWPAVQAGLKLLLPLGICVICIYPGHAAGQEEKSRLLDAFAALPPREFTVLRHQFLNAGAGAPECIVIQRQE